MAAPDDAPWDGDGPPAPAPGPRALLLRGGRTPEPVDVRLRAGRVVEVGPRLEHGADEAVVDLGGRFVRRGLRDAHAHVAQWARSRRAVDVSPARSAEEAAALVARALASPREGTRPAVLEGRGLRDDTWPAPPRAAVLDAAAPGVPVVLHSLDLHSAWLSSAALALAGLPDHPTGLLQEHEAWEALARLPAPGEADDDAAVAAAVAAAQALGVTAVRDFDIEGGLPAWRRRHAAAGGRLGLRVTAVVPHARLPAYAERGWRTGVGDAFLRVGPVKLFADGSLGSRTARCLRPYAGTSDRGRRLLDPDALRAALAAVRAAGCEVAVHAIGDEATRDALHALAVAGVPASLEHAQLLRGEDLPLFARAGVVASVQPAHLLDDRDLVERHWAGTTSLAYAGRSLLAAGARLVLGSDAPVAPLDPWLALAAAVHRTDGTAPPWRPEEALPLEAALAASGARRVRAGDAADLVVVDLPGVAGLGPADLAAPPVHATMLDGAWVHGPWRAR